MKLIKFNATNTQLYEILYLARFFKNYELGRWSEAVDIKENDIEILDTFNVSNTLALCYSKRYLNDYIKLNSTLNHKYVQVGDFILTKDGNEFYLSHRTISNIERLVNDAIEISSYITSTIKEYSTSFNNQLKLEEKIINSCVYNNEQYKTTDIREEVTELVYEDELEL